MKAALATVVLALALGGCTGGNLAGRTFEPTVYVVRPGDTVYSIAWRYQIDPEDLVRWNDLENPDRLRIGQRLRLAPRATASGVDAPPDSAPARGGDRDRAGTAATTAAPQESASREWVARGEPGTWRWPTEGRVVGTFGDGRVAGRGVDIAGRVGQPVQATAAGKVVYSGEGLQAYGRLVIIRHEGDYVSAYAHNSELLVREGQRVTAGQQIARMGESGDGGAMLHFEIRRQGRPVDPLEYLPPRD